MSQSLYTAMSGISAATTELQIISNNVANINTTAFKASSVNFSDVYSRTISFGSVASGATGGTNPIQVGVGTQVSSVSKNFTNGSAISTGQAKDLMIEGSGFFTVKGSDAKTYFTRAGDFSWDNGGNLVTTDGYKVLGTNSILSTASSAATVKVPNSIIAVVEGNKAIGAQAAENLNGVTAPITSGDLTIAGTKSLGTEVSFTINLSNSDLGGTVQNMLDQMNDKLSHFPTSTTTATSTTGGTVTTTTTVNTTDSGIRTSCADGTISFTMTDASNLVSLTFGSQAAIGRSNFVTQTNIANSPLKDGKYTSKILDYTATITDVTSAANATSINSIAINKDGSIQGTYADGGTLSVALGSDLTNYDFTYTTGEGVEITGNSLNVSTDVAVPANFVIQVSTVTNTDGMIATGSNLFEAGPNCGSIVYTVGGEMGAGSIVSGYLEASNVDLSEELSSMILAQRGIEANSRVFSATSDIMSTVVNMGR